MDTSRWDPVCCPQPLLGAAASASPALENCSVSRGLVGRGNSGLPVTAKILLNGEKKKVNVKVKEALVHICLFRKTIDVECGNRYRGICCGMECCIETLHSRSGLHSHGDLEWFLAISLENACQFLISALKEDVNCTLQNILKLVLPSGCF